ncbi:MAG: hypothetical protein HOM77_07695, partial [Planctomycetes bacterium]|nr:hypothetical protein [Planctomycetota bacterium]
MKVSLTPLIARLAVLLASYASSTHPAFSGLAGDLSMEHISTPDHGLIAHFGCAIDEKLKLNPPISRHQALGQIFNMPQNLPAADAKHVGQNTCG